MAGFDGQVIELPPPTSTPGREKEPPTRETSAPSPPVITALPEIYQHSAPMLRCSHGHVHHIDLGDGAGIHVAFFAWDGADTGSVLEAFRHMPEACMGAIGLQLVSREPPVIHTLPAPDGHPPRQGGRNPASTTLVFDHTVFHDPRATTAHPFAPAQVIHAFRAVWVAGVENADPRVGIRGRQFTHLRSIRLDAARSRFRPPHARVIQGAVRGIPDPSLAWQTFEQHVLGQVRQSRPAP